MTASDGMIVLAIDQLVRLVLERGVDVRLVDGSLRYRGPRLAPGDPLAVALAAHCDELIRLLTPAPRPWPRFEPGPPYFAQLGPNTWRETAWSAAGCIYGDATLAPGDRLHCPVHAAEYAAATRAGASGPTVRAPATGTAA